MYKSQLFLFTSVWRNPKSERNRIRNFFPIPIFFDTESDTFFDTKFFPIPIPILFSIPNFFETDTDTFFDTKKNRNRYQYFYRYQNFSKPIPILSKNIEKFRNRFLCDSRICICVYFLLPKSTTGREAKGRGFVNLFYDPVQISLWGLSRR